MRSRPDCAPRFTAVLAGEQSLLVQCGEILLSRGHHIALVIARDAEIGRWATGQRIPVVPSLTAAAHLLAQEFDYFFSIGNLQVVPGEVLCLPRRAAINFHDALLPRYAGLHATSWALINSERRHGISWHLMTAGVDRGDLLKQRDFALEPDETAFSLNLRCYEAAIETFEELVDELAEGRVERQNQDLELRTYFGHHLRPKAAAVIDWAASAEEIDALVRALDFGPYPNPLALPKVIVEDDVYIVDTLSCSGVRSGAPAGTVMSLADSGLTVATATQDVIIGSLRSFVGQPVALPKLVGRSGWRAGSRLDGLSPTRADALTALNDEICRQERFWVEALEPLSEYGTRNDRGACAEASGATAGRLNQTVSLPMPIRLALNELPSQRAIIALACALALASRCGEEDIVGVCIRHGSLLNRIAGFEQIFADAVPVMLRLNGDRGEVSSVRRLQDRLDEIMRTRLTFAWDILLRHPSLHKIPAIANRTLLPLMVEQVTPGIAHSPLPESDLSLLVGPDDLRWSFASTIKPARIALIEARLPSYLAEAMQCG